MVTGFDILGRLKESRRYQSASGTGGRELSHKVYDYDNASNITFIHDFRSESDAHYFEDETYDLKMEYDSHYRLTKTVYMHSVDGETDGDETDDMFRIMTYSYDALGNIVSKHTETDIGGVNPVDEYYDKWFGEAVYEAGRPHAMKSATADADNHLEIEYDDNGNMVSLSVTKK